MGACNCTDGNNDLASTVELEKKNIEMKQRALDRAHEDSLDMTLPDIKASPLKAKEINKIVQGLARGYLVRSNFFKLPIRNSLKDIYSSLGQLDFGKINEVTCQFQGGIYIGEVNQFNEPDGCGRLFLDDQIFEGIWMNGKMNGNGRSLNYSGDIYVGGWKNGLRDGYGELESETIYKGDWFNDQPHGRGIETWPDGSRFEGDYYAGLRHGKGTFLWADGSSYKGEFKYNCIEGYGKYIWKNSKSYEGQWKNNQMHGKGAFIWEDGRKYEGEYCENKKHGFGVLVLKNGKKYEGNWANGKQHGKGKLFSSNCQKIGNWENGRYCS